MSAIILRRRKLGRTSAREIAGMSTTGIKGIRNWRLKDLRSIANEQALTVFRWGCTSALQELGICAAVTVNSSDSIRWCSEKRQGRLDMQAAGVPVPRTWGSAVEWWDALPGGTIAPVVVRPVQHAQGRNLLHTCEPREVREFEQTHGAVYVSEYVKKVAEYRVLVCQNRVVWVAQKTPGNPEDVAWNVAKGGRFDNVKWSEWPLPVIKAAMAAAKVSKTDFCGVDVMTDAEGNPYVLEVNSAPSQTSPYRQSCLAKAFDYIVQNGKKHFEDVKDGPKRTWKSYIHPAVRGDDA